MLRTDVRARDEVGQDRLDPLLEVAVFWASGKAWHQLPAPTTRISTYGAPATWTRSSVLIVNGHACLPGMSDQSELPVPVSVVDPGTGRWSTWTPNAGYGPVVWTGDALVEFSAAPESRNGSVASNRST
jgi:hypothetical protein